MSQHCLGLEIADRAIAHRLAAALTDLMTPPAQALSIFEGDGNWRIEAYYADSDRPQSVAAYVANACEMIEIAPIAYRWAPVPDENWVAVSQAALPPVITRRFIVHGSHDREIVGRRRLAIEIDAGEAFGTAHHATTFGCLEAIDRALPPSHVQAVLDLGTGSGVLAIAAARLFPSAHIIASDIDRDSIIVAQRNAAQNAATHNIEVVRADGLPAGRGMPKRYDLVIANILAGPLCTLAASIAPAVRRGGRIILSGILNHQAATVSAHYRAHGFSVQRHARLEGWTTLTMRQHRARR